MLEANTPLTLTSSSGVYEFELLMTRLCPLWLLICLIRNYFDFLLPFYRKLKLSNLLPQNIYKYLYMATKLSIYVQNMHFTSKDSNITKDFDQLLLFPTKGVLDWKRIEQKLKWETHVVQAVLLLFHIMLSTREEKTVQFNNISRIYSTLVIL